MTTLRRFSLARGVLPIYLLSAFSIISDSSGPDWRVSPFSISCRFSVSTDYDSSKSTILERTRAPRPGPLVEECGSCHVWNYPLFTETL